MNSGSQSSPIAEALPSNNGSQSISLLGVICIFYRKFRLNTIPSPCFSGSHTSVLAATRLPNSGTVRATP